MVNFNLLSESFNNNDPTKKPPNPRETTLKPLNNFYETEMFQLKQSICLQKSFTVLLLLQLSVPSTFLHYWCLLTTFEWLLGAEETAAWQGHFRISGVLYQSLLTLAGDRLILVVYESRRGPRLNELIRKDQNHTALVCIRRHF